MRFMKYHEIARWERLDFEFLSHSFDTLNVPYHRAPRYFGILLCHVAAPAYASQRRNYLHEA